MALRDYPNKNFAWYNDDKRLAIIARDITSTDTSERTVEPYDSWQGDGNLSGTMTTFEAVGESGATRATCSAAHNLEDGDRITITSSPDGYYNSTFTVDSPPSSTQFYIPVVYSAEDSGTFTSLFINDGLRITYHSKYETITTANLTGELSTTHGLDTGMQNALLCYVKARLLEDQGNLENAQYFRAMYEKAVKQYPSRKSGVRQLSVPRL